MRKSPDQGIFENFAVSRCSMERIGDKGAQFLEICQRETRRRVLTRIKAERHPIRKVDSSEAAAAL